MEKLAISKRIDFQVIILFFALVLGLISAATVWWNRGSLWEDEIIAITHGLQPFPEFFIEILRNDIHPFFYFLLLKIWTSFNYGSDGWALASSLVSALCSAAAIAYVTFRTYGQQASLWATTLFCVLPTFASSAGNLRMYGLVPCMAVLCWFANREFLGSGRVRWVWILILVQVMQTYTHAIGFFFAAFFALAALVEQWDLIDRRRLRVWAGAQFICLVSMLPVVASALVRGTEPLSAPSLFSLVSYPAQVVSVWGSTSDPMTFAGGSATFAFLLLFGLNDTRGRIPVLVISCGALLACIVVSSFGKPMFKPPVFTANLVPFLVIGAAVGIVKTQWISLRAVAFACTIFMSISTLLWAQDFRIAGNYQSAARYLVTHTRPGDIVIVPNVSMFWGIARYAVGPAWGHPLDVMPLQSNEAWTKLKARLGGEWVDLLNLTPATDYVDSRQVRYVIGNEAKVHTLNARQVWIVHRDGYKETVRLGIPVMVEKVSWFGELSVSLGRPSPTGATLVSNPPRF